MFGSILAVIAIFLSSNSYSNFISANATMTSDSLIETGVCTFLNGHIPYEYRSISFGNLSHFYIDLLPSNRTYNFTSPATTFDSACPNPGPGFRVDLSVY